MKYFTNDLMARFGSDDDAIADQAQTDWEAASAGYQAHYKAIEKSLPAALRSLLDRFYLHDARVIGMALESPFLFLTVHLDPPPREVLVLQYHLIKSEVIRHPAGDDPCPHLEWLYDEVDLKRTDGIAYFEHAVRLTNGMEIVNSFLEFDYLVQPSPMALIESGLFENAHFPPTVGRPQFIPSEINLRAAAG